MALYKTHVRFNVCLALPLCLGGLFMVVEPQIEYMATFSGCFLYGTLYMNPDLDLIGQIKLFSLRGLLTLPFRFYSAVFKHRGLSHHFLWGTCTRLLWLMGVAFGVIYVNNIAFRHEEFLSFVMRNKQYFLYGLAGLFFADLSHLFLDRIYSLRK